MAGSAYSPEEIETIYRRNFTLVYQLCMVLMRSVPDAEDAALTVISCAAGVVSGGVRRLIDCFGGGEQVEELIPPCGGGPVPHLRERLDGGDQPGAGRPSLSGGAGGRDRPRGYGAEPGGAA